MVRVVRTDELSPTEVSRLRALFSAAWENDPEEFTDEDWDHATGGVHFLVQEGEEILAHASVVERELHTNGRRLRTGYVEAVATWPGQQRRGHGSTVMREVADHIDRAFELGALGTGRIAFYERLGWVVWKGLTYVRTGSGLLRTEEEDGYVLVRLTPASPALDLSAPISCDWRPGDVW